MKYLLLCILFLLLSFLKLTGPLRMVFQKGLNPVQLGLRDTALDLKDAFKFISDLKDIRDENIALIEEKRKLEDAMLNLKNYALENEVLKQQLGMKESTSFDRELLMVNVLGNAEDLSYSTIYIDRGFKHGVSVGDMVILGNSLIGKVREVTYEKSLVDLITSPNFSATVMDIDTASKTQGVCAGKYGLYMEMTRILQVDEVNVGDTVVTSGKDGVFLSGFAVGKVVSVSDLPTEPLKVAQIEPLIDLKAVRKLFVVLSK
ncbi:MAG: rod shape-determining protein MreC [Patescibacteria group bacterium]|jgi:rod shape-determining protein MreC